MKLAQYTFEGFTPELISSSPAPNRDECKLLVLDRKTGNIEHRMFKDVLDYFSDKDTFIFNNTKVFPARLYGNKEKTGARIEIFLLRELNAEQRLWDVMVDPARKIRIGNKLYFSDDDILVAEVIDNTTSRGRTLRFLFDGTDEEFRECLYSLGETPLPRRIRQEVIPEDEEDYQNIYATEEGAVTVPAAGLHFSKHLLKRMQIKGVNKVDITLHAGLGNFRTIDVEDLTKHKLDSEQVIITPEACDAINSTKENGHKVCAVGTTVMRAIESTVTTKGMVTPINGWTNKFITPPYDFGVADCMITNFHLPKSTQLIMVAAFTGYDLLINTYETAIKEGYKFDAYGDAMLIL